MNGLERWNVVAESLARSVKKNLIRVSGYGRGVSIITQSSDAYAISARNVGRKLQRTFGNTLQVADVR